MHKPSVCIIDDDEEVCIEISSMLSASGYACRWSSSPTWSPDESNESTDVVVLDLSMPGADGFEVIQAIAAAAQPPHLIIASGHEERIIRAAVRSAEQAGLYVLGSLEKPYPVASLIALIELRGDSRPKAADNQSLLVSQIVSSNCLEDHVRTAFQSKRQLSDSSVIGYEALLRLSVDREPVSPELLFQPGIDLGVQLRVTRAVLNDAMRFGAELRANGRLVPVAINSTAAILCAPQFPELVATALNLWNMPATSLQIEITEHETTQSFEALAAAASRLALRGSGIAIDDFGRGATSLERLFDLPLAEVKVDKEIFWQCANGRAPLSFLQEVARYCEQRKISSTVEGIETRSQLELAIALGANCGQGFLWDRPRGPAEALNNPAGHEIGRSKTGARPMENRQRTGICDRVGP